MGMCVVMTPWKAGLGLFWGGWSRGAGAALSLLLLLLRSPPLPGEGHAVREHRRDGHLLCQGPQEEGDGRYVEKKWQVAPQQGCSHTVPCASPAPSPVHSPTPGCRCPQVTLCPLAGTYYQTTDRGEVRGNLFTLTLPNVSMSENGVYSATFMGDSPLWSAFYRLIVRGEQVRGGGTPLSLPVSQGHVALLDQCHPTAPLLSPQHAPRRSGDRPARRTVPTA